MGLKRSRLNASRFLGASHVAYDDFLRDESEGFSVVLIGGRQEKLGCCLGYIKKSVRVLELGSPFLSFISTDTTHHVFIATDTSG